MKSTVSQISQSLRGALYADEPLAHYTSWRVGGAAQFLYKPADLADLVQFMRMIPAQEPLLWLGLGSNTLVRAGGFAGTVVITQGCLMNMALVDKQVVRVEAGVSCASMARFCARQSLAGAEFWAGIPGTMGGALRMNAGCFNGETWDQLCSVETLDRQGELHQRQAQDYNIAYRRVTGPDHEWFVAAHFKLRTGDKESALAVIRELLARRAETQPIDQHNCGSVFRNPDGDHAARLIEVCGLKGYRIGGAQVSTKHANFIVNDDNATATDIEKLITYVANQVAVQTGVSLQREVHIVGQA